MPDHGKLGSHRYLSTACIHNKHDVCRETCKYCGNHCVCNCHDTGPRPIGGSSLRERVRDAGISVGLIFLCVLVSLWILGVISGTAAYMVLMLALCVDGIRGVWCAWRGPRA